MTGRPRSVASVLANSSAELLVLGAAALARFDPRPRVRPSLLRLTGTFEDSVILSIPSGIESLCVEALRRECATCEVLWSGAAHQSAMATRSAGRRTRVH